MPNTETRHIGTNGVPHLSRWLIDVFKPDITNYSERSFVGSAPGARGVLRLRSVV